RGRMVRAATRALTGSAALRGATGATFVRRAIPAPQRSPMTDLPATTEKKLGLVIDLDTCVGCHACVTSCKEWNTGGHMAPLTDLDPYGGNVDGVWFNRVHTYEHDCEGAG